MANRNVTVVCRSSQFKDYVSAKERMAFCDVENSLVTKITKTGLENRKIGVLHRHIFSSRKALA